MRTIDKIRNKISAARAAARKLMELETRTEEQDRELEKLTKGLERLELDYRAALRLDSIGGAEAQAREGEAAAAAEAAEMPPEENAETPPEENAETPPEENAESAPASTAAAPAEPERRYPRPAPEPPAGSPSARRNPPERRGFRRPQGSSEGAGVHTGATGWSAEAREYLGLCARSRVGTFLDSAARTEPIFAGPEAELRSVLRGAMTEIPWGAIVSHDDLLQIRADTANVFPTGTGGAGDIMAVQRPIIRRVFSTTVASHLNVMIDSVGVGEALYHILIDGNDAQFIGDRDAFGASGANIQSRSLPPERLTAAYHLDYTDMARIQGLETALRSDLAMSMTDALDRSVLVGGADPNVPGFLSGRSSGDPSTDNALVLPADPTSVVTFETGSHAVTGLVDGLYARNSMDLRVVIGPSTNGLFESLFASNTAVNLMEFLARRVGSSGVAICANIPAAASDIQQAVVARVGGTGPNAVCPVWASGVNVIRDDVTGLERGRVRLQMIALHNFKVLRRAAYSALKYKLA